jgi:hypothetical protein
MRLDFLSSLGVTAAAPSRSSALNAKCTRAPTVLPGVYGNGVLTIVERNASKRLLTEWSWLLPSGSAAVATTGFGDVFYVDENQDVYFLEVQIAHVEFIDSDPLWVINEFMRKPSVSENVLRAPQLASQVASQRQLGYGECFILRPWELLGGDQNAGPYDIGKVDVYLSLVGQTIWQVLSSKRKPGQA